MNEQNEDTRGQEPAQPPANGQSPAPEPLAPPSRRDTDPYVIWGFVLAGLGLFCCCCPPLFAIPAIVLGAIAYSRGDQRGLWVIIAGAVVLLAGSTFSIVFKPYRWGPHVDPRLPYPWRFV